MKRIFGAFEAVFDTAYLLTALILGIILISTATSRPIGFLGGAAALVLVAGDAFHLVPRIASIVLNRKEELRKALGIGKQITSVTMTVFYILLWHMGTAYFSIDNSKFTTYAVYILALVRILLCLLPQNGWTAPNPPLFWAIIRNIPFFLLGIIVARMYFQNPGGGLNLMWAAITLSFLFYLPVVLFSERFPKIGMLMLPKTLAYLWMLFMFLSA